MEILNIIMDNRPKAFLSKKNPLNIDFTTAESFSYAYLMPQYWFSWILILFSFILIYLPKKIRINIGSLLGIFIKVSNTKRSRIVMTNLSLCFKSMSNKERKIIHDNYFKNLGKTILDIPSLTEFTAALTTSTTMSTVAKTIAKAISATEAAAL